ncbi:MAG: molybdopterin-guanine dinucleotide biosynthesis protein B [Rubripirellula sp.]|nr:molybdopterin-guanine dinucleotide biosynthesis protein B [Rubripirellula sp.]
MQRLHVIGRKNHGKTTLVSELIVRLTELGYRVGAIKHTHHDHELDTPGKDSHRHRTSGAACVGILSPQLNACFWKDETARDDERYAAFAVMFANCDLVIVEGDSQTGADKIEVWRQAQGDAPLKAADPTILAIVTDDVATDPSHSKLARSPIDELIDWIVNRYLRS